MDAPGCLLGRLGMQVALGIFNNRDEKRASWSEFGAVKMVVVAVVVVVVVRL